MSIRVYLIGSLRNPRVPIVGKLLRSYGYDVFDDWYGAGEEADDKWQEYEEGRDRSMAEALGGKAAMNTFTFDHDNLVLSDVAVLLAPCGKSGHLELGYFLGMGKPGYVYFEEEPERWDVMYNFANGVFTDIQELLGAISIHEVGV